jgi:ubiquinone/menaquinone biosynthesis C-methylase UbiE
MRPRLSNATTNDGDFDGIADFFDDLPIGARKGSQLFLGLMPEKKRRALDVGCGTGRTCAALSPHFEEVYGVDISLRMIDKARQRCQYGAIRNVMLATMDAENLSFGADTFDYVVSHTTLHHTKDVVRCLRESKRVLAPGGRIVFVDILRAGVTGFSPVLATRMLAIAAFVRVFLKSGIAGARAIYAHATDERWLEHQQHERFFELPALRSAVLDVFGDAQIRTRRGECGLTHFVEIQWNKPTTGGDT